MGAVGHIVSHQVDVIEVGRNAFNIDPFLRAFHVGPDGDGQQLAFIQCFMQLCQQQREVGTIRRLAFDQPPGTVNRVFPVEIDAVQMILLDDLLHRADKHRPAFRCGSCA
ncbi:hypothetical protein D3C80_1841280 [compost metagenome]